LYITQCNNFHKKDLWVFYFFNRETESILPFHWYNGAQSPIVETSSRLRLII